MHTNLSPPLSFLSPPPPNLGENPNVKPLPKAIFLKTICLYINPQETFRLCKGFHIGLHKTSSVGDELGQGWCPAGMTIHEYMLDEDAKRWHGCWCPPRRCSEKQSVAALRLVTCVARTAGITGNGGLGFTWNPLGKQQRSPHPQCHCWSHRRPWHASLLAALASRALTTVVQLLSPFSKVQYKLICPNIQESSLH